MKLTVILCSAAALMMSCPTAQAALADDLAGRGIWVNGPAKFDARQAAFLRSIGVRRVHLMLTHDLEVYTDCGAARAPGKIVSVEKLVAAMGVARAAGLKIVVTRYVPPSKTIIDSMLDADSLLAAALGEDDLTGVEYDLEGKWVKSPACGLANHQAAVDYLIARTRAVRPGIAVGVTVHYGRLNSAAIAIEKFDWVAAQAYSKCAHPPCAERRQDIARPPKGDLAALRAYTAALGSAWDNPDNQPGTMQRNAARKLGQRQQYVIIGLPAYSQFWNGRHTVTQAMQLAHDAVTQLRIEDPYYVGTNYWALTNILSTKSHPDIKKFLEASAEVADAPLAVVPCKDALNER